MRGICEFAGRAFEAAPFPRQVNLSIGTRYAIWAGREGAISQFGNLILRCIAQCETWGAWLGAGGRGDGRWRRAGAMLYLEHLVCNM